MRFTLQHVLLWQANCLFLTALNFVIGGTCDCWQGMITQMVCGLGCVWGIWRHRKKNPDVPIASNRRILKSMFFSVVLSMIVGWLFGVQSYEICTRTFCQRITRNFGVLNPTNLVWNEEAIFIRDTLKFKPKEHNWVRTCTYLLGGVGCNMPSFRYPALNLGPTELSRLSSLKPVKKCHSLFMLDNPLDVRIAKIRERVFYELHSMDEDQMPIEKWWRINEPLLRPMRSNEDVEAAARDWSSDSERMKYGDMQYQELISFLPPKK